MKKNTFYSIAFILLSFTFLQAQTVTFTPEKPTTGEKVKITYDPAKGDLAGKTLSCTLLAFGNDTPVAHELTMKQKDGKWLTSYSLTPEDNFFTVSFNDIDDNENIDNNESKGYNSYVYNEDKVSAKSVLSKAQLYYRYGYGIGFEDNNAKAAKKFAKAFKMDSSLKKDNLTSYLYALRSSKTDNFDELVQGEIAELKQLNNPSEKDLVMLHSIYRMIKDKENQELLKNKILKKYKNGDFAMNQAFTNFYQEKDLNAKKKLYKQYIKKYGKRENNQVSLSNFYMAREYLKLENWDEMEKYSQLQEEKSMQARLYNNAATALIGKEGEEAKDLEKGMVYATKALELYKESLSNTEDKPTYYTEKAWKNSANYSIKLFASTIVNGYNKSGDLENAMKYQKIASKADKYKTPEQNEMMASLLEELSTTQKTSDFLADKIRKGVSTQKMRDQFRRLSLDNNSKQDIFEKYYALLKEEANAKKYQEIMDKLIEEDAPNFVLKNLEGEVVSLSDMRGKVVMLDFWATWCGPCINSFPAMQRVVEKYRNDDDVELLFMDTWQSENTDEEKIAAVKEFLSDKPYTFNVVMDLKDKVVQDYGVSGIPTKFVVDKNGKIRFKSVGFYGSDEGAVDELSMMIEIARKKSEEKTNLLVSGKE